MALPRNRRIFDMGAHSKDYTETMTIITAPVEMPRDAMRTFSRPWLEQAPAENRQLLGGFDRGRPGGDDSAVVVLAKVAGRVWLRASATYSPFPHPPAVPGWIPATDNPWRDHSTRGAYLCEICFDVMTDGVIPADESGTGLEMAWCGCVRELEEECS